MQEYNDTIPDDLYFDWIGVESDDLYFDCYTTSEASGEFY